MEVEDAVPGDGPAAERSAAHTAAVVALQQRVVAARKQRAASAWYDDYLDDLALQLCEALQWDALRDNQLSAMRAVIVDRSPTMVMWAPGRGKTAVFFGAVLAVRGLWVLVVPTNSILETHAAVLRTLGVRVLRLVGLERDASFRAVETATVGCDPLVVIAHPEELVSAGFMKAWSDAIERGAAMGLCVDEASIIPDWGTLFRKDFLGLHTLAMSPRVRVLVLDGSSPPRVRERIWKALGITGVGESGRVEFVDAPDRPNVDLEIIHDASRDLRAKVERISAVAQKHSRNDRGESVFGGIVFCNSTAKCEEVQKLLAAYAITHPDLVPFTAGQIDTYHREKGSTQHPRALAQKLERFNAGETKIIVATVLLGRGMNLRNVRWTFQLDMPSDISEWYQKWSRVHREDFEGVGFSHTAWSWREYCVTRWSTYTTEGWGTTAAELAVAAGAGAAGAGAGAEVDDDADDRSVVIRGKKRAVAGASSDAVIAQRRLDIIEKRRALDEWMLLCFRCRHVRRVKRHLRKKDGKKKNASGKKKGGKKRAKRKAKTPVPVVIVPGQQGTCIHVQLGQSYLGPAAVVPTALHVTRGASAAAAAPPLRLPHYIACGSRCSSCVQLSTNERADPMTRRGASKGRDGRCLDGDGFALSPAACLAQITEIGRQFLNRPYHSAAGCHSVHTIGALSMHLCDETGLHEDCIEMCIRCTIVRGFLDHTPPAASRERTGGGAALSGGGGASLSGGGRAVLCPPHLSWSVVETDEGEAASVWDTDVSIEFR